MASWFWDGGAPTPTPVTNGRLLPIGVLELRTTTNHFYHGNTTTLQPNSMSLLTSVLPRTLSHVFVAFTAGRVALWLHNRGKFRRYVDKLSTTYPESELQTHRKSILTKIREDVRKGKISKEDGDKADRWLQDKLAAKVIEAVGVIQQSEQPERAIGEPEVEGHPGPFVRRGRRWNAAHEICVRCVAELGRKPYSAAMSDTVSNVARRFMKEMHVRHSDIPKILPQVIVTYFTPTEEDLMMAAVLNSEAHRHLRAAVEVRP